MTDRRPGRSSMCVAEQQAAPDRKKPGHSIFPTGADGSSPSTLSSVAGRGPVEGSIPRGTSADPEQEHPAPHS
jgi:hypothetical protein